MERAMTLTRGIGFGELVAQRAKTGQLAVATEN